MKRFHNLITPAMMKLAIVLWMGVAAIRAGAAGDGFSYAGAKGVTWRTLGTNEDDSLPLGNGDIAANVWTEQSGDVVILLAKADAWTELGQIVKLGRVRVHLDPNPFTGTTNFSQILRLENASVELKSGGNTARLWIDANRPVMHIETHLEKPAELQASLELWRKPYALHERVHEPGATKDYGGDAVPVDFIGDTVLPATATRLTWFHYNTNSTYPLILEQQHLGSLTDKYPDPLLHRCFGSTISGVGLASVGDRTLKSSAPQKDFVVDVVALTGTNVASAQNWQNDLDALVQRVESVKLSAAWDEHQEWWRNFWDRSWIQVAGDAAAEQVSQGYAMQRYMMACSSRGTLPVKFNGGLFTVGHDMSGNAGMSATNHNPDYRAWGNCYWNQNNRLPYWPLLATGDYDLLKPWFDMYLNVLPLAKDRTRIYYHHDGASLPETMYFFGLPSIRDFGRDNPANEIQSVWQRYHIQGTLEVIAQMLDYCDHTGDSSFARTSLVPFADAIVTYYDQHYLRDEQGKIKIAPAQSLETYQLVATNPTPDIAGLRATIPRLLELPHDVTTEAQRAAWAKTLKELPPIPLGHTTAKGKIPPLGNGATNGALTILPAEQYGPTHNSENPELYVAVQYRLYGAGKPDLGLARTAYAARRSPQKTCWGQDGTQASVLGLTDEAQKTVISEFTNFGGQRFPWFWKAAHDWIPDLDNGGSGMITLQNMLMQCDGKRIILLPAWPKSWAADFKLHAPFNTTVTAHVQDGTISAMHVIPESRAKDVEIWKDPNP